MEVQIADLSIPYQIIQSNRRSLSMEVTEKGEVIARVPYGLSTREVERFLKSRQRWLYTRVKAARQNSQAASNYETGRRLLYLGQPLELIVEQGSRSEVVLSEQQLIVKIPSHKKEMVQELLEAWYRMQARVLLTAMTEHFAKEMRLQVNKIFIKDQKTRWGSCSSNHNINYNYRLIMAPMEVIEYVVIHELCHLIHMNHSKDFWYEVEKRQPTYRSNRQWLKEHQSELRL